MEKEEVTKNVRARYGAVAKQGGTCGCGDSNAQAQFSSCCGGGSPNAVKSISKSVGYSDAEMSEVPDGANLGLGCGNPVAMASLKEGEVVLDLGSGGGFDCFLAAARVGAKGKVIGVDMTPEMLDRARENLRKGKYSNVEFRLGEIENLPVADNYVDAIISNCVINLSLDKKKVFKEAFRVLKPGGRLMVSDIVLLGELPQNVMDSISAYVGCIAGASKKSDYISAIEAAGFKDVKVIEETAFPLGSLSTDPTVKGIIEELEITPEKVQEIAKSVVSIKVYGLKK